MARLDSQPYVSLNAGGWLLQGALWTVARAVHAQAGTVSGEDIRDIMVVPPPPNVWLIGGIALAVVILCAVVIGLLIKWVARPKKTKAVRPEIVALHRLRDISSRLDELSPNKASLEASETVKDYLSAKFKDPIRYETAEEYLGRMILEIPGNSGLSPNLTEVVKSFVSLSQELKFAKLSQAKGRVPTLISQAEKIISLASAS